MSTQQPPAGKGRAVVYIDGFCTFCRAAGQRISALDVFHRIAVTSFRHDAGFAAYGITLQALERAMHVVVLNRRGYRVRSGYPAVLAVIQHLPVLWPLLPLAWLVGACGLGGPAYRWLAAHRLIVPDPTLCAGGACAVQAPDDV